MNQAFYIFEELIRKFSENAEAGDHYTGRDIIKLMVSLLLAEGCDDIFDEGKIITILDQAAGTGGMLSVADNYIKNFNPSADVRLFSQEINPESYAMCLAEMLIRGQDAENIKLQDTMKADAFPNTKMRFCIMNPPFGQPWGGKDAPEGVEQAVREEYLKGEDSRWPAGLPGTGDRAGSDRQGGPHHPRHPGQLRMGPPDLLRGARCRRAPGSGQVEPV